jgi:molybdate transport system substrate-binding protein
VVGGMPAGTEIITTFSGGVCAASPQPEAVRALLAFMQSPAAADTICRYGMEPA